MKKTMEGSTMRKRRLSIGGIAAMLTLALGCGPAASNVGTQAPEVAATPTSAGVAARTLPAAAEAEDAMSRYAPPPQGDARAPDVKVVDVTTPHGVSARLVESPGIPIVSSTVIVRWTTAPKLEGTNGMLALTLPRSVLGSGRTLRDEIRDLGAQLTVFGVEDGLVMNLAAMPHLFEPSLAVVIDALRKGKITAAAMDAMRKVAKSENPPERVATNIEGALRWAAPRLFPSGHMFHFAVVASEEDAQKTKPEDLMRFRDAALSLESISLAVAGAITKGELSDAIEKATSGWKASGKKIAAPAAPTAGAFLLDEPDRSDVGVVVSFSTSAPSAADLGAARVARQLLIDRMSARVRELWPGDNPSPGTFKLRARTTGHALDWFVTASNAEAKVIAEGVFRGIDDLAKGEVTEMNMASARSVVTPRFSGRDGLEAFLYPMVEEMMYGSPAGSILLGSSPLSASRTDVLRLAAAMFRKDRVSLVAKGRVASEKEAFEKLGFAKVTVESLAKKGGKR